MASDAYKLLYQGAPGTTPADVYEVPAGKSAIRQHLRCINPTNEAITFIEYRNGLTSDDIAHPAIVVPANDVWVDPTVVAYGEGETIGFECSSDDGLVIIDGDEVTY